MDNIKELASVTYQCLEELASIIKYNHSSPYGSVKECVALAYKELTEIINQDMVQDVIQIMKQKKIEAKRIKDESCKHENKKEEKDYIEGTYYDRCQYITRIRCVDCGTVVSETSKSGGYG